MRQEQINKTIKAGGKIINHTLVKQDNTVFQGKKSKVTDRQIAKVIENTGAIEIVGYDKTRTVKIH